MELLDGFDTLAVERAVTLLRGGEVIAFPTETVYGLGADACNADAVAKIFELKKRPRFDPLIVHISRKEWVVDLARSVPPKAQRLMDRFWPGPLTLIMEKTDLIPDIVTAGLQTVGIRMPGHPVALDLITRLGHPIAAPSANPFGYMSTTTARDVANLFDHRLPLILDGGPASYGIESTIVSVRDGLVRIHRHGSVSAEQLAEVIGKVIEKEHDAAPCESPGELPYHYAPHTPLRIIRTPAEIEVGNSAFLAFRQPRTPVRARHVLVLSPAGDMREAAARFFSSLIELDGTASEIIYAEAIPERGLGKAMMERLRKAAKKTGGCASTAFPGV
jgi:L-threonylcarbamoyladenylate synthase